MKFLNKIFTIHIDVFYGLEFFQQALHNIRNQTYSNLEIIISNNSKSKGLELGKIYKIKKKVFKFQNHLLNSTYHLL